MLASESCRRALCLAALAVCASARAQGAEAAAAPSATSPLTLTWTSSDPSCDGASVGSRALELVAQGVTPRPTEARARVDREGSRWLVDLETRSESKLGRRQLRGESCQEIREAIALLLAMILEAEAKAAPPAPPPAPAPAAVLPLGPSLDSGQPERDEAPAPIPAPPPPPSRGWGAVLRAQGVAALGVQPALGLGVGGAVGGAYGPFELLVNGTYWPSSRISIFDRDGAMEMQRRALGFTACYEIWSAGPLRAVPCLSPEMVWREWRSLGLRVPRGDSDHTPTLSAYLDLRTQLVGPVFISLLPGVTWERPRSFQAKRCDNCTSSDVFQVWGIAPILGAGAGARF